jgi:sugar lactone lactonase YvrE
MAQRGRSSSLRTKVCSILFIFIVSSNLIAQETGKPPEESPELKRLLAKGAKVEKSVGEQIFTEGPVWHIDGYLLFSDLGNNRIMKWHPKDGLTEYRAPSNKSNGLAFNKNRELVACEHNSRRVSITKADGKVETLVDSFEGKRLNSPNDLAIAKDGSIYFTDPPFGLNKQQEDKQLDFNGVYRLTPQGKLILLTKDFDRPNGIAFSPNQKTLYIADSARMHVRAFDVRPDGTITNSRIFGELKPWGPNIKGSPDGMKVDIKGNVYATGAGGVWVFNSKGKLLGVIQTPEAPTNCGFGDADFKTLYITARTSVYRIRLTVPGLRY